CSLRLTNCYGPRQVTDRHTQGAFPFFIGRALAGQSITLYDEGQFKRDINFVDDVVEALLLAGENDAAIGEAFNLGSPPITLREFVETLGEVVGGVDVHYIPYPPQRRAIEIGDTYCEYGKISRTLNWLPRTSLHDGLRQTIAWHRAHGS
ncbi:MAG: NAD-dependent epimerase/dehydratase family protein, partial [Chloroflexota bacterium]|nr:NAD-dependent epimerase/dehydratase family protein [Chloroflexota bacterium]